MDITSLLSNGCVILVAAFSVDYCDNFLFAGTGTCQLNRDDFGGDENHDFGIVRGDAGIPE